MKLKEQIIVQYIAGMTPTEIARATIFGKILASLKVNNIVIASKRTKRFYDWVFAGRSRTSEYLYKLGWWN